MRESIKMAAKEENTNIKIPSTKEDITPNWVREVTGHSVLEDNFSVEGDIQKGSGLMSNMCRVSYDTSDGSRESIIVKLLPTNEEMLGLALSDAMDEREIKFYSTVVPDLVKIVPEIKENICKVYNGTVQQNPRASMLIMEDLKALGFRMMEVSGKTSEENLKSIITFMARLHCGAYTVEQKKGVPLPELYPFLQGITDAGDAKWRKQMETLCEGGYKDLDELLTANKVSEEVRSKYQLLKPYVSVMVRKIAENGRKNPCLIHADLWPPNVLVHDSLPIKIIDWQWLGYKDATFDLSVMLYLSLPKEKLNKAVMTDLLKMYFNEFERLCKEGGLQHQKRTWEEFEEFFFTWGTAYVYMACLPYLKDLPNYANAFRVMCEESHLPEFLLKECSS